MLVPVMFSSQLSHDLQVRLVHAPAGAFSLLLGPCMTGISSRIFFLSFFTFKRRREMHYNIIILEHDIDPWWWCQWATVVVSMGDGGGSIRGGVGDMQRSPSDGETHSSCSLPVRVGAAYVDGCPSAALPLRQGACRHRNRYFVSSITLTLHQRPEPAPPTPLCEIKSCFVRLALILCS